MQGFSSPSKLLQKKWEQQEHKRHMKKVNAVKPQLDNAPPRQYPHLVVRLKKIQQEEQRQAEIEHENKILLQKMSSIMTHRGSLDNWNDYEPRSLNHYLREQMQDKIAEENLGLARRLQAIRPQYDVDKWEEEFHKHEYFLDMWAGSTKDFGPLHRGSQKYEDTYYESDFEEEDEEDAMLKLPKIGSRMSSQMSQATPRKEPGILKLPKIKSQKETSADADAKLLFRAVKQLAKGDEVILKALIRRTHSQRMMTMQTFHEHYDLDLVTELKAAMGPNYKALIDCLLTDRQKTDALTLHAAINKNDVAGIVEILCTRYSTAIAAIKKAYETDFSVSFKEDIQRNLQDKDCQDLVLALTSTERPQIMNVDQNKADYEAEDLCSSGEDRFTHPEGLFLKILRRESIAQIRALFNSYKTMSGGQLLADGAHNDGCSSNFVEAVRGLDHCLNSPPGAYADKIHSHLRPNDKVLIELLLARSETDMKAIRRAYKRKYALELIEAIMNKCGEASPLIAHIAAKETSGGQNKDQGKRVNGVLVPGPPKKVPLRRPPESQKDFDLSQKSPLGKKMSPETKRRGQPYGKLLTDRTPRVEEDVRRLQEAMQGWSIDEGPLIEILTSRNNAHRQMLKRKYGKTYKKDLMEKLESELSGDFEEVILALMMTPTEYDAYCLHDAIDGLGTSEATLIGILCTRSPKEMEAIRIEYRKKYNAALIDALRDDTSGAFEDLLVQLAQGSRELGEAVNKKRAQADAKRLYQDGAVLDIEVFTEITTKRTWPQMRITFDEYKKLYKQEVDEAIRDSVSGNAEDAFLSLVMALRDPAKFYATRLHEATSGMGTNDTRLIRIIVSRLEVDLPEIRAKYRELYGSRLEDVLDNECSGDYKKLLVALVTRK
ncbi:Annexin A13 [Lamellibrachia satsuma]|nr:Annexin A13 [Lamellibrachia satsuma]